MKIVVKNKDKFYKMLYFYKSAIFKLIKFETTEDDEELNSIVTALNIKSRKKRITYIYDYACKKIDKFYEGKNICGFKENKCLNQQAPNCKLQNGCCRLCPYQSEKGCPTSNLSCKLFYCGTITNKNKTIKFSDLKILKLFSLRQRIIVLDSFFSTREQILFDLYVGSIFIYAFRLVLRSFLNFVKLRKSQ